MLWPMRVYLDNCCFNRPFDSQGQTRVRLEAEAKLCIQEKIREGALELAWSYILDYENAFNPYEDRRKAISVWRQFASADVGETEPLLKQAHLLALIGLKPKDSLHIACAMAAGCDYFVSTDDAILRRREGVQYIVIIDPPSLVRELEL
jgi:hypothetical protein